MPSRRSRRRLICTSPRPKQSGKTRLLEAAERVVARPWLTSRTSPATLYRKTDAEAPTLLLDEGDAAFNGDREYAEVLRGLLNAGHRRGGTVTVCVGQGAKISYKDFSAFGPKAIAGIGQLPDTVADRAIPIRLKRRKRSEPIERFRRRDAGERAKELYRTLLLWASSPSEVIEPLRLARPQLPEALSDRAQDVCEPLLAIADLAEGQWPERARGALVNLCAGQEPEEETIRVRLLADVRQAFEERGADRLASSELLDQLRGLEEAPWADWYGKPLSGRKLADLLRPYEIKSRSVRLPDGTTPKGYHREQFDDAWDRYLPQDPPANPPQRHNGSTKPKTGASDPPQAEACGASENSHKPHQKADVAHVALLNPDTGEGE